MTDTDKRFYVLRVVDKYNEAGELVEKAPLARVILKGHTFCRETRPVRYIDGKPKRDVDGTTVRDYYPGEVAKLTVEEAEELQRLIEKDPVRMGVHIGAFLKIEPLGAAFGVDIDATSRKRAQIDKINAELAQLAFDLADADGDDDMVADIREQIADARVRLNKLQGEMPK